MVTLFQVFRYDILVLDQGTTYFFLGVLADMRVSPTSQNTSKECYTNIPA